MSTPRTGGAQPLGSARVTLIPLIMGVETFTMLPGYLLVRARLRSALEKRYSEARDEAERGLVPRELFSLAVIGGAMAEGIGFFGTVIYLLGGSWVTLLAPAVSVLLIAFQIPTKGGIDQAVRAARPAGNG